MTNSATHATNKKAVYANLHALCSVPINELNAAVAATYADDARLFAFHPVNEHQGSAAIADALWRPIRESFPDIERRDQIVIAGEYDGNDYVCAMGQLQGTFSQDWYDIPAGHGVATLRYGEVHQIGDGLITRSHVIIDVLDLMHQVGCWPISPSLGAEGAWQSPATQDGVNLDSVDPETGAEALALCKKMHAGLLEFDGTLDSFNSAGELR